MAVILGVLVWATLADSALASPPNRRPLAEQRAEDKDAVARAALKFSRLFTAECMLHHSQLLRIANTDPTRTVRVVLQSYTGKTRSQDRSIKLLAPKSGPVPLGCDGVAGLKRRWVIEESRFVEDGNTGASPGRTLSRGAISNGLR